VRRRPLEHDLTPLGAERAGNAEAAYRAGPAACPAAENISRSMHHPDPYAKYCSSIQIQAMNMRADAQPVPRPCRKLLKRNPDY